jgi:pimeloyl-ACP methyl ester carboxylesterase
MESAQSHMGLAEALADAFTVYLPDRRGRGRSGPYAKDYRPEQDVADMDTLLSATGAQYVFGVSSGADVWLEAALSLPNIEKMALYEPALSINGSISMDFLARYDREIARGDVTAALVTGMLGAQMGPGFLNAMPRWLLKAMTSSGMKREEKQARPGEVTMRELAPTLHYDFALVAAASNDLERFRTINAEVLLLGGGKSPAYLKTALDTLEAILPHARRLTFPSLNHGGSSDPGSTNPGGRPELVAQALRAFFSAP